MIGKYKIVRKAEIEDYEARIETMRIAKEAAEERAVTAEVEKDAMAELLAEARDVCIEVSDEAKRLTELVINKQKTIKAQKKDIDRLLGETLQLTLEVEALRQENAALRKIAQADGKIAQEDAAVTIDDDAEEAGEDICEITLCTESEEA